MDRLISSTPDKKFHLTANGKDVPLTPFYVWPQKRTGPDTTSTVIDMKADSGKVYEVAVLTTGAKVTSVKVNRVNGEDTR